MTTTSAGRIPADWLSAAYSNATADDGVSDWFARALNARSISIDADGGVWAERAGGTGWLSQEQIDAAIAAIDAGV